MQPGEGQGILKVIDSLGHTIEHLSNQNGALQQENSTLKARLAELEPQVAPPADAPPAKAPSKKTKSA